MTRVGGELGCAVLFCISSKYLVPCECLTYPHRPLQASLPSSFRDYTNVPFVLDTVFITYDDPEVFRAKFPVHAAALAGNALELRARLFPRVVGTERTGSGCDAAASMRPMSAAARKNRVILDERDAVGWTAVRRVVPLSHSNFVTIFLVASRRSARPLALRRCAGQW